MSALPDLRGKAAVVTGGASGIGKGIAARLIAEGMRVIIADIERGALEKTAAELGATAAGVDVSDAGSVAALAERAIAEFGTVHVVCNNACVGPMAPVADLTMADWDWIIGVNLYGVIHGVQTFLPVLKANPDGGHIVNTASMAGLVAPPRMAAYCVTKFGVVALTEVLAAELTAEDSKVGVSVLCPGTVRTNIGASSRNRPQHLAGGGLADVDISGDDNPFFRWISPEDAGPVRPHPPRVVRHGRTAAPGHRGRVPPGRRRRLTAGATGPGAEPRRRPLAWPLPVTSATSSGHLPVRMPIATASTTALRKKLSTPCTITCQRMACVLTLTPETANEVPAVNEKYRKSVAIGMVQRGNSRPPPATGPARRARRAARGRRLVLPPGVEPGVPGVQQQPRGDGRDAAEEPDRLPVVGMAAAGEHRVGAAHPEQAGGDGQAEAEPGTGE
jgi:NAD(P)-dependent dehydrogenase (short-subunit alcohol dehydrogenase family)